MDLPPAPQAFNQNPSTHSQSEEDTSSSPLRCFPFLNLPLEIQLLIYRCALTRPHPILLQAHHGQRTQETVMSPVSRVSQSNVPGYVFEEHSDIGHDALSSNSEKEEFNSTLVDAPSDAETGPIQRYAFVILSY
jgi:hypothetical protein